MNLLYLAIIQDLKNFTVKCLVFLCCAKMEIVVRSVTIFANDNRSHVNSCILSYAIVDVAKFCGEVVPVRATLSCTLQLPPPPVKIAPNTPNMTRYPIKSPCSQF